MLLLKFAFQPEKKAKAIFEARTGGTSSVRRIAAFQRPHPLPPSQGHSNREALWPVNKPVIWVLSRGSRPVLALDGGLIILFSLPVVQTAKKPETCEPVALREHRQVLFYISGRKVTWSENLQFPAGTRTRRPSSPPMTSSEENFLLRTMQEVQARLKCDKPLLLYYAATFTEKKKIYIHNIYNIYIYTYIYFFFLTLYMHYETKKEGTVSQRLHVKRGKSGGRK